MRVRVPTPSPRKITKISPIPPSSVTPALGSRRNRTQVKVPLLGHLLNDVVGGGDKRCKYECALVDKWSMWVLVGSKVADLFSVCVLRMSSPMSVNVHHGQVAPDDGAALPTLVEHDDFVDRRCCN